MKLRQLVLCLILPLAAGISQVCLASPIIYTAVLNGASESSPNLSPATGFATFTLNGNSLGIVLTYSGLVATPVAAHIHCCAAPGIAAPVEVPFLSFPTATSGTYTNTVDLSTLLYTPGFSEATLLAGLNAGLTYVNVHSTTYPGGEIRGQISAPTPEPGSLILLGTGLLGLWKLRRTNPM